MNIATKAELDELPVMTVVIDPMENVWQRHRNQFHDERDWNGPDEMFEWGTLKVIYLPSEAR